MFGSYLVVQCWVSFPVLQSSPWGRENWLLYFSCLLDVMWLLKFFNSFTWCSGLVCRGRFTLFFDSQRGQDVQGWVIPCWFENSSATGNISASS